MALTGSLHTHDETFRAHVAGMLRAAPAAVLVGDDKAVTRANSAPDLVIVDARADVASAIAVVERLRAADANASIFFVAAEAQTDVILGAMRAGANEFFVWPPPGDAFDEALRRVAARRASQPSARPQARMLVFFGAKGGAGTTTLAVNSAIEVARLSRRKTVIVDLKAGLGEVSLFLGVRTRYTLLDALDNLHRLDDEFMRELACKHKSGIEILAGSELFDRPGGGDSSALEEVFAMLGRHYEFIVVDAGSHLSACAVATLFAADTICFVANPDVPSVRNAQRLLDRIGQLGASGDRIRVLLNRAAEPFPIPLSQIQDAIGHPIDQTFPSDYRTVSTALNSGVPLTLAGNSALAARFDSFTRRLLDPAAPAPAAAATKRTLGLPRLASIW